MTRLEISSVASAHSQRGQIIIMIVLIMAIGTGYLLFSLSNTRDVAARRNAKTDAAMALVKQALIGYAAAPPAHPGNTERPGELPCPDMTNDGSEDGSCAPGVVGRVPWKTLGIPPPTDGYGEVLWYALAGPFRNENMSASPITSDTLGTLTVYQGSSAVTQTNQAVAVLIAPGPTIGTQTRSCTVGTNCDAYLKCTSTPASLTPLCNATNYLEPTGGGNNAQTNGPFIQAATSGTFNDRVLAITNADLMPVVEQRVAREIMAVLNQYRLATGEYPWADLADGGSNGGPTAADGYYNRNRFPCKQAKPADWGAAGITLPDWLTNGCSPPPPIPPNIVSGWSSVIYYAVAKNMLDGGGTNCTNCFATSTLTVNNPNSAVADLCPASPVPLVCTPTVLSSTGSADVVLITPGSATASRIGGWSPTSFNPITGYFEDSENSDDNDDTYVVPTSTKNDRDRLYIMR